MNTHTNTLIKLAKETFSINQNLFDYFPPSKNIRAWYFG